MQNFFHTHQRQIEIWGTAVFALIFYWFTLAPDLTWQDFSGDGGELITAAVTLGIPHPPGYPTYIVLGKLASYLPLEPVALRFHLFSALCAAGAAGFVTATAQHLIAQAKNKYQQPLAVIPGLLFAFSPLVWQQAVVAEVYCLNLFMIAAFLWALIANHGPLLTGLLLGLSLTTHLTSIFLLPLALALTPSKDYGRLAAGGIAGVTPFLLLPILAKQGSPVIWGDPTTVAGWWWLVSGQIYLPNQFALPPGAIWSRLISWLGTFSRQLGVVSWFLMVRHGRTLLRNRWYGLAGTAVFYIFYAWLYNTKDAIVLTLPAWLLFAVYLIPALEKVGKWGLILPGLALLLNLSGQVGGNIHNIRLEAEQIFSASPPDAILMTSGDPDIFAMWYFHHVEGFREDIILVDDKLFAFDWYRQTLKHQQPSLRALEEDNITLFEQANISQRRVCRVGFSSAQAAEPKIDCFQDGN